MSESSDKKPKRWIGELLEEELRFSDEPTPVIDAVARPRSFDEEWDLLLPPDVDAPSKSR